MSDKEVHYRITCLVCDPGCQGSIRVWTTNERTLWALSHRSATGHNLWFLPTEGWTVMLSPDGSYFEETHSNLPKLRVYISGPMSGMPEDNYPAFNAAAEKLKAMGLDVENPAEKGKVDGWSYQDYLRYDIRKMCDCDAVYFLTGWQMSVGAKFEYEVAEKLGLIMMREPNARAV